MEKRFSCTVMTGPDVVLKLMTSCSLRTVYDMQRVSEQFSPTNGGSTHPPKQNLTMYGRERGPSVCPLALAFVCRRRKP